MQRSRIRGFLAGALLMAAGAAQAQTLRIGLQDDPDALDPARSRTLTGRIVFASLCDKLVDIDGDLKFTPRLATEWAYGPDGKSLTMKLRDGVKFHDGEAFDAAAVKYNIERAKTLPDSFRKSELASVESVTINDAHSVTFNLSRPDATLVAQLSDRAGMMVSPKAAEASGAQFPQKPVCSGPFKFVERVAQDRIVLERFKDYWSQAAFHYDRVVFLPIPDSTVRFANLRSGDLQLIERVAPSDVKALKADPALAFMQAPSLGYNSLLINVANGDRAKTPTGMDKRVRQALELGLDRQAISDVAFEGVYPPMNQPYSDASPWYDKDLPIPARDVEKAKRLLTEAGVTGRLPVEVTVATSSLEQQVTQLIQSMWAEIGVDVTIKATEFATMLKEGQAGNFQIAQYGWSGRVDPDGNIHAFVTCTGGLNDWKYCNPEVDKLLNEARTIPDAARRKPLYDAAQKILLADLPIIYTYQQPWLFGATKKLQGFKPFADGMIRLDNVSLAK